MQYTSKDIADMIGVEAVTVRKYALALEKAGYTVERSTGDKRVYSERDAMLFRQLVALRERSGMSVEMSANVVAIRHKEALQHEGKSLELAIQQDAAQYVERYKMLSEQQEKNNALMMERLEGLEARIGQKLAATSESFIEHIEGLEVKLENAIHNVEERVLSRIETHKRSGFFRFLFRFLFGLFQRKKNSDKVSL